MERSVCPKEITHGPAPQFGWENLRVDYPWDRPHGHGKGPDKDQNPQQQPPVADPGEKVTIQLNSDSSILLFTDGITEIKDEKNNLIGKEILMEVISQNITLSSKEIINKVITEVQKLRIAQANQDDLTILGIDCTLSEV